MGDIWGPWKPEKTFTLSTDGHTLLGWLDEHERDLQGMLWKPAREAADKIVLLAFSRDQVLQGRRMGAQPGRGGIPADAIPTYESRDGLEVIYYSPSLCQSFQTNSGFAGTPLRIVEFELSPIADDIRVLARCVDRSFYGLFNSLVDECIKVFSPTAATSRTQLNQRPQNEAESQQRAPLIFISYAKEDRQAARDLYEKLREKQLRPWMDSEDLLPGEEWEPTIEGTIRRSDFLIICLSTKSVSKRGYVQSEIKLALKEAQQLPDGAIYLIPVRLDDCQVPDNIAKYQYVDMFCPNGFGRVLDAIRLCRSNKGALPSGEEPYTQDDIIAAFSQIPDFSERDVRNELVSIHTHLVHNRFVTKQRLYELVNSKDTLDVLRRLYIEELRRPADSPLDPVAVAAWGTHLLNHQLSGEAIGFVRQGIRGSPEYERKHI